MYENQAGIKNEIFWKEHLAMIVFGGLGRTLEDMATAGLGWDGGIETGDGWRKNPNTVSFWIGF